MFSLKTDFCFSSFNVRGLQDNVKRKALFLFCKSKKAHCYMLQETHWSDLDEKFWTNHWGDKIFCHGMNRSAGVAIFFHNCPGKVIVYKSSDNGHWLMFIIIGNIYGYNNINQNRELLSDVSAVIMGLKLKYSTDNIILGGDFNMVQDDWLDRFPSKFNSHHYNPILCNFCSSFGLFDPWRDLYPNVCQYSWLKPDGTSKSRLDFWLISFHIKGNILDCYQFPIIV